MAKGLYGKLSWGNLRKNYRLTLPYLFSSTGICMMFYMLCALGQGIDKNAMYGGQSVAAMMELGVYVIGIFAVLFLFYTNSFIMKRRKKELGLYNILGMEKRHIARVILAETLMVACACILLGLVLGILFSKVLFLALGKVLGLTVPIAFLVPAKAVTATVLLFLAIFALILFYNILQVKLSKPIELLQGSQVGEKEPKAHWLLAILGVLLLGAGYYLAVTIQSPIEAIMFFFVAVVLVILGTYMLFIVGITALLKLLKKNKRFYYKTRHFTAVSGMLYRMKQNAAGLASICILSTCLLVTVSTTFSLYTGIEDLIHSRYPREYSLILRNPNDAAIETMHTLAGEEAAKLGVSQENAYEYKVRMWNTARTGTDFHIGDDSYSTTYAIFQASTLEEFNRFSGRQESLEPGQVLLSDPRNSFDSPTISFDGKEFSVKETDYTAEGEMNAVVYEVYTIVFPDEETILSLLSQEQLDVYRADVPRWYYYFDLSGDDESLQAFSDAMDRHIEEDFPMAGVKFESLRTDDAFNAREDFLSLYGGLFFLGMFLGLLFLLGTALIIYYKQVSEGYEDAKRFAIMQKVGMSRQEVKRSIHSQIILVFFLPLLAAILHLVFAFPMLQRIMALMNMVNYQLILFSTIGCVAVFALFYFIIYACTARTYYKIVEQG